MSNPTPGDIHVNVPLGNVSVAWMQAQSQFIADRVFPNVPVTQQSNRYYKYDRSEWNRAEAKLRAPGTETAGGGWTLSDDTYVCDIWGIHKDVSDPVRANADSVFNLDRESTEWVSLQILLRREKQFVSSFFATGIWTGDQTGVAATPGANQFLQWNDAASDPIGDIKAQNLVVTRRTGGFRPNRLVLGPETYNVLSDHPDIIERIKYSERGVVTPDLLATLFDVPQVLIPFPVENTAAEGIAENSQFLFGKAALLVYAAPNPGLMTATGGYTFGWTGYLGASAMGTRIKKFRMEELASDRIEAEAAFDMKVVDAAAGVFFTAAVA